MAYPFGKAPTFGELKSKLINDFGCEFKAETDVTNQAGQPFKIEYFERKINGTVFTCTVSFENDSDIVSLWTVQNICDRLKITPRPYGLTLDININ